MGTLIFVHGTGVRAAGYEQALGLVNSGVDGLGLTVQEALWGPSLGARLLADGVTVPTDVEKLGVDGQSPEDQQIALWSLLYQDPLYELRLIGSDPAPDANAFVPGQKTPGQSLQDAINHLFNSPPPDGISAALAEANLSSEALLEAARQVVTSATFSSMLPLVREPLGPVRMAVARAFVAQLVVDQSTGEIVLQLSQCDVSTPSLDAAVRDRLVAALAEALGPAELGFGSWIGGRLLGLAQRWGTSRVVRNRGQLTQVIYPGVGDILRYQVRGQPVREFIRERIAESKPPILLFAHSLGGIMCTDLLISDDLSKRVCLFVTVGSQAPFLYEMDVLPNLRWKAPLPAHFPPWLNIYDRRDFLSYVGSTVFGARVKDFAIDNGQPFPQSHSAYFANRLVWDEIRTEWIARSQAWNNP